MIYSALAKTGFKMPGVIDPDSKRRIGILYRPDTWAADTVYYLRRDDDYDVVVPTGTNGFYYKVISPGRSGATEPTWPTVVGQTIASGSALFEAVAYNLLPPTETITTSAWTATGEVELTDEAFTDGKTSVLIDAIPAGVTGFTLTNRITLSGGEVDDVSLIFKVAER